MAFQSHPSYQIFHVFNTWQPLMGNYHFFSLSTTARTQRAIVGDSRLIVFVM